MGRACMELWTNVHFVLKLIVVVLMMVVEFLVFDLSTKQYYRLVYLEAYYFIVLSYLIILLYGYTWFDTTPILEIFMVIASIIMLVFTVIFYVQDYNSKYIVHKQEQEKFVIFLVLSLAALVLLIIDFLLFILEAFGKGPSFSKGGQSRTAEA